MHLSDDDISRAKEVDVLSYLQKCEPDELVRLSGNCYSIKSHDSLKISNGKWMWWSQGIGGYNAVDYLMTVKGMPFIESCRTVLCNSFSVNINAKNTAQKVLILPEKSESTEVIREYLLSRCISDSVIDFFISNGSIYENKSTHSVVFLGFDNDNIPRYAGIRGTGNSFFKGECYGSNKAYTFRLVNKNSDSVHLFEGVIDLLSFATLCEMKNIEWKKLNLLSLSGVYNASQFDKAFKVPVSVGKFIEDNENVRKFFLHLDNDIAGRNATAVLMKLLKEKFIVNNSPVPFGKDVNDYLCKISGVAPVKNIKERRCER